MITVILTSSTEHFRKRLESAGDIQVMDSDVNNVKSSFQREHFVDLLN